MKLPPDLTILTILTINIRSQTIKLSNITSLQPKNFVKFFIKYQHDSYVYDLFKPIRIYYTSMCSIIRNLIEI